MLFPLRNDIIMILHLSSKFNLWMQENNNSFYDTNLVTHISIVSIIKLYASIDFVLDIHVLDR